jgi:uncharacterized membrane protein
VIIFWNLPHLSRHEVVEVDLFGHAVQRRRHRHHARHEHLTPAIAIAAIAIAVAVAVAFGVIDQSVLHILEEQVGEQEVAQVVSGEAHLQRT